MRSICWVATPARRWPTPRPDEQRLLESVASCAAHAVPEPSRWARWAARADSAWGSARLRRHLRARGGQLGDERWLDLPGGARVRHRLSGPEQAPAIVLVPDPPNTIEHYDELTTRLVAQRRVLCLDPPGFGLSPAGPGFSFTLDELAWGVAATCDALALRQVTLSIGCVGAFVGLRLARLRPDLVARLVLVQMPAPDGMLAWMRAGYWWLFGTPFLGQLATTVLARRVAQAWYGTCLGPGTSVDALRAPASTLLERGGLFPLASAFQMFRPDGLAGGEALPPTTVVWGAADSTHAALDRAALRAFLPRARALELPRAGHYPDIEDPEHHGALLLG